MPAPGRRCQIRRPAARAVADVVAQLLGIGWTDGGPALRYRPAPFRPDEDELPLVPGGRLAFEITGPKRCTGYRDATSGAWTLCPRGRVLRTPAAAQCALCRGREVALVQPDRTGAFAEAARAIQLARDHVAYLALFGRDHVKVGVTSAWRAERRLVEQGAAAGLIFAAGDGVAARRLERAAARLPGIADQVRTRRKVAALLDPPSPDEAAAALGAARNRVATALDDGLRPLLAPQPRLVYLRDRYLGAIPPPPLRFVRRLAPGDRIGGTVAAVVGALALLAPEGCAVDGHLLAGYPVRFLDFVESAGRVRLQASMEVIQPLQRRLFS